MAAHVYFLTSVGRGGERVIETLSGDSRAKFRREEDVILPLVPTLENAGERENAFA